MKTNSKIILVVLITALAIVVFVWTYIKKGKTKKEALDFKVQKELEQPNQAANSAVKPSSPTTEQPTVRKDDKVSDESVASPEKKSLEIISIELDKGINKRNFEYVMNYQGHIVRGSYKDALLPLDYSGSPINLLTKKHNGVVFKVTASMYNPSLRKERKVYKSEADQGQLAKSQKMRMSTKAGAVTQKTGAINMKEPFIVIGNKKIVDIKPLSIILSISKEDETVLQWKMVDLLTGDVYNGIKGFKEADGAAYKEGDLSKKIYYL